MLNPVRTVHHVAVGLAAAAMPVLVLVGIAGDGDHPERFDAKQVLVTPAGDGVRIREVVDQDFGNTDRHGYQRVVPNDFGAASAVTASSPDAPDALSVSDEGFQTRIRIGDPDSTVDGQHRYVLEYTLPGAQLSSGALSLDIIGTDETLETRRFDVVLSGFVLDDPHCSVGTSGTDGGCTLELQGGVYRAVFEPLRAGEGITVGGTIRDIGAPVDVPAPAIPVRRGEHSPWPLAGSCAGLGAITGLGTFRWMRRRGRNRVGGTGAADAAFGGASTRLVTDEELDALATTEFEPPRGLRPWHGAILLRERIDDVTVGAWFSDQIAQGVLELRDDGDVLAPGPALATAPPITKSRVEALLAGEPTLALGKYQPRLKSLWKEIQDEQRVAVKEAGWWDRHPPGASAGAGAIILVLLFLGLMFGGFSLIVALRHNPVATVISAAVAPLFAAAVCYGPLLPSRSADGSAVALRTESFRRFLEASEGRHVEWAWQHGLLRDYTAWAVALGAADAWGRAISACTVPPADLSYATMPLLMHTNATAWHSTYTAPSSSGSGGGGGGFSVGGGGGGGSSGSW